KKFGMTEHSAGHLGAGSVVTDWWREDREVLRPHRGLCGPPFYADHLLDDAGEFGGGSAGEVFEDTVGEVLGIDGDASEAAGAPGVEPGEADEVEAGLGGDAAVVAGIAALIEDGELHEAEVGAEADRPDDRADLLAGEVESLGR